MHRSYHSNAYRSGSELWSPLCQECVYTLCLVLRAECAVVEGSLKLIVSAETIGYVLVSLTSSCVVNGTYLCKLPPLP
jgi:hypothetical protein